MGKYTLFGKEVTFSKPAEEYATLQYLCDVSLAHAAADFQQWYSGCGSIEKVLRAYPEKAISIAYSCSCEPLFGLFPKLELYDVSEDSYREECFYYDDIDGAYDKVATQFNRIVSEQDARVAYRAARKAGRSRVVGGGFGVSGAIKGMATAGAMNMASGVAHGAFNAIGNLGSSISAASSKRALYDNSGTYSTLFQGIAETMWSAFAAHISFVNNRKGEVYYDASAFDTDKESALLENAKKLPEKRQELLVDAFGHCPWDEELLQYIFVNFEEERKNVWTISKKFHVDLSEEVETILSNLYTGDATETESAALEVKAKMQSIMAEYGIKSSEAFNELEQDCVMRLCEDYAESDAAAREKIFKKLESYDALKENKAAVVEELGMWEVAKRYGVSFSKEDAEEIIAAEYTEEGQKNESVAIEDRKRILKIMKTLGVSTSATLNRLENDCLARISKGYETADEATCEKMLKKLKAFEASDSNIKKYVNKVQARIEAIWSAEDGEIFDNVFLKTNIYDPQSVQEAIDFINTKGRTASSKKYLAALGLCNEAGIKKALANNSAPVKLGRFIGGIFIAIAIIVNAKQKMSFFAGLKCNWDNPENCVNLYSGVE